MNVPVNRLGEIESVFKQHSIPYWVDVFAVSFDDGTGFIDIELGRAADPQVVQGLLDNLFDPAADDGANPDPAVTVELDRIF